MRCSGVHVNVEKVDTAVSLLKGAALNCYRYFRAHQKWSPYRKGLL